MAENSNISWTKSTFNPWIGCTKIGPGCDHCYADALDERRLSKTLGEGTPAIPVRHWGAGAPRYRTSISNWNLPRKWNRQAPSTTFAGRPGFWPVFCASLADVFDNEVPPEWRADLWQLIAETPNLTWLLVTKRIGNAAAMAPPGGFPKNVWLLITVTDQAEADRDIPKLEAIDVKCHGISYEPAIGPVDWTAHLGLVRDPINRLNRVRYPMLEWIIVGGESTQGTGSARPFHYEWAREAIAQGAASNTAIFVKQAGAFPIARDGGRIFLADKAGADPSEWPEWLRVQQFPLQDYPYRKPA